MIEVTLTHFEMVSAAIQALMEERPDQHGFEGEDGDGWHIHIEGSCGEMAFAKALGLYWSGTVGTFKWR
jgi:hypothetical protein